MIFLVMTNASQIGPITTKYVQPGRKVQNSRLNPSLKEAISKASLLKLDYLLHSFPSFLLMHTQFLPRLEF